MSDIVALVGVDYSVAFGSDTTVPDVVDDTNVVVEDVVAVVYLQLV